MIQLGAFWIMTDWIVRFSYNAEERSIWIKFASGSSNFRHYCTVEEYDDFVREMHSLKNKFNLPEATVIRPETPHSIIKFKETGARI